MTLLVIILAWPFVSVLVGLLLGRFIHVGMNT